MGKEMESKHIIDILESASLTGISEAELTTIRLHSDSCESCGKAFEAAQQASYLIRQRCREKIEPSPFFQTRVMAAWKEQQATESVPAIVRLWRSAGALVSTMALTTAALAAFSFVLPASSNGVGQEAVAQNSYSAEGVILGQDQNDDQISYEQVLNTIYEDEAK